jgi:2,5-diamino-6-(ribosylamino)-4(3H)-pyrimidinone 5'-phosphate reductase
VRVDSGGSLIGALLSADLLDEVNLLVHPRLAGVHSGRPWHGFAPPPAGAPALVTSKTFSDGLVWLRYRLQR